MHDQRKARMAAQGNMSLSREFRGIQCDAKSAIRDGAEPMRGYLPQPLKRRKVDEVQGEADAHCDELNPSSPPLSPPLSVPSCLAPHNVGAFSQSLQQLPRRRRSAGRGEPCVKADIEEQDGTDDTTDNETGGEDYDDNLGRDSDGCEDGAASGRAGQRGGKGCDLRARTCPVCGTVYPSPCRMEDHARVSHSLEAQTRGTYSCSHCNRSFFLEQNALSHVKFARNCKGAYVVAPSTMAAAADSRARSLQPGSRVDAKYQNSSQFYPGRVTRNNGDGTFDVSFDDGDRDPNVPAHNIMCSVDHSAGAASGFRSQDDNHAAALLKRASLFAGGFHDKLSAMSKLHCQMLVNIARVLVSTPACACASAGGEGGVIEAADHSACAAAGHLHCAERCNTAPVPESTSAGHVRRRACV